MRLRALRSFPRLVYDTACWLSLAAACGFPICRHQNQRLKASHFENLRMPSNYLFYFCFILTRLEDLDQLAGRQSENDASGGVYSRLVALLLMYLDGVASNNGNLVLIATTQTRPENLDSRVIRPGRFDHWVHVPLPSALDR